ncbi:unnamed protein product, partial [Symbiodinium sp. CCMP2456]
SCLGFLLPPASGFGLPSLPDSCLGLCRALTLSELTAHQRAERAWLAGCWARAVLTAEADRHDPTPPIGLSSRYYCILRASGRESPAVVSSLAAFRRIVGPDLGTSVTHDFPSTSECRVFFAEELEQGHQAEEAEGIGPSLSHGSFTGQHLFQDDRLAGLFQQPASIPGSSLQTFSPLAEQRWITVALAFVKELETISVRRAEVAPKQKSPAVPPALPKPDPPDQLSRKQQRAAAWAAKKATEAKK